ncbi:hypothetical protein [Mycoplasmopsis sturni]|nr:hypothetical protein [Mycoplasmopsis sturni]
MKEKYWKDYYDKNPSELYEATDYPEWEKEQEVQEKKQKEDELTLGM